MVYGTDEFEEICEPMKKVSDFAYNYCVSHGYDLARYFLDGEIDAWIDNITEHPDMYSITSNIPPDELGEISKYAKLNATFSEEDVIDVMESWVDDVVNNANQMKGKIDLEILEYLTDAIFTDTMENIAFKRAEESIKETLDERGIKK